MGIYIVIPYYKQLSLCMQNKARTNPFYQSFDGERVNSFKYYTSTKLNCPRTIHPWDCNFSLILINCHDMVYWQLSLAIFITRKIKASSLVSLHKQNKWNTNSGSICYFSRLESALQLKRSQVGAILAQVYQLFSAVSPSLFL